MKSPSLAARGSLWSVWRMMRLQFRAAYQNRNWRALLRNLLLRFFRRKRCVVFSADCTNASPPIFPPLYQLLQIDHRNFSAHHTSTLQQFWSKCEPQPFAEMIAKGNECFLVLDRQRDAFVHMSFLLHHTKTSQLLGATMETPLIGYCHTLPVARGHGLYPLTLQAICAYISQRGIKRVLIETAPENSSSIRGIKKAGFQFATEVEFATLFGILVYRQYYPAQFPFVPPS